MPFWWQYASLARRFSIIASRIVSGVRNPNTPGIADVQRNDVVPHPLHFVGAPRQIATNLVTDVGKAGAGTDGAHGKRPLG